ncbi:anoctamin-8 isoform X2 [Spea bombifrons]|uniref:anoctamin-8 isoform X2 n=1 Tax=Spea bombifrons TaxID=233779 RepID=UPI0023490DA2|nr:anoctamin-8 isoform X2 [Spea bombifrons]
MPDTEPDRGRKAQSDGERAEPAANPHGTTGVLDKLFGKRLLQAGRYITSHKSWMKTVPTENCDVVMTFPDTTDDHTLLWLLNHVRLGIPELIMQIRHQRHTRIYAFFVTSTYENLLRGAEEIGLRKPVKAEFGGGTRIFSCEEDYIYQNIENELNFFTSQERQSIIRYWMENLRAKHGESLHNIHFLEGQPIIPELTARGVIQQVFPVHEQRILSRLMKSWVQAVCERQPLDEICDYFGVKVAMYFSWLGFYTSSLVYPAMFGMMLWFFTESDQTSRDICCVVFALFNVIWATLFLEGWKRRGAEQAYKWGTLDTPAEFIEEPRPQFRGVKRISPVTNCEEFYYPPWKRLLFQSCVSLPVCVSCLCFVFVVMLACFELQEFVLSIKELPRLVRFFPKILLAVIVSSCDEVYRKIAYWLNDMENYRLQSAYEKHLIIKIVLFQFVNSYLSLFYIGFYLKDMERLKELLLVFSLPQSITRQTKDALLPFLTLQFHLFFIFLRALLRSAGCLIRSKMLATLLVIRQFLQNMKEVSQPHLYQKIQQGELNPQSAWHIIHHGLRRMLQKYVIPQRPTWFSGDSMEPGSVGRKKCLNGGCGVPEEEEEGIASEDDETEEESIMDCGLKLKRVSFVEKGEKRGEGCILPQQEEEDGFLQEGSPTLVEKGSDPASVFQLEEDEEDERETDGLQDGGEQETGVKLRQYRRSRKKVTVGEELRKGGEEEEYELDKKQKRDSWMVPPDEFYPTKLSQAEVESCMKKYEDTFQDYQEMFVQFGYVVLFSSAFPLAALCALINNIIEIRSDAFKLCSGYQRPFGRRVDGIGQWQNVMEAMGVIAIIVNCYLIGQCGQLQRLLPWLGPESVIIFIVVLEHFALLLKYIIHVVIPDIPGWVAEEMAKLEYQRREAFKKHERQAQHRYQQQQRRKREEEERQRHADYHARKERESRGADEGRPPGQDSQSHEKNTSKPKPCGPSGGNTHDKPKRPSSLLASNNVLKLKQIIPLQSKFLSGTNAKSPQSPPGGDTKIPSFLSFKFLKSPETRREATPERAHSPTKPFNPGKLFNFGGKGEGQVGGNGLGVPISMQPRGATGMGSSSDGTVPGKSQLNGLSEDISMDDGEDQGKAHKQ